MKIEKFSMFGKPFYVLSEDQIDIRRTRMTAMDDLKIYIGTHIIASIH